MPRTRPTVLAASATGALGLALFAGCTGDNNNNDNNSSPPPPAATRPLTLAFTGLPALGAAYVYEGWLVTPGGAVSAGRFTVNAAGAAVPATFNVPATTAAAATKYILTIEPAVGDVPAPAATHVLAGALTGTTTRTAAVTIGDGDALGTAFAAATGSYVLAAPTLGAGADYRNGVWFLVNSTPPAASLVLPVLPAGWQYEGWVIRADGTKHSTGRFTNAAAADSTVAAGAPSFPGQDFSFSLIGAQIAISVEPQPDDHADPFPIIPLMDAAVTDTGMGATQTMAAGPIPPSGTITIGAAPAPLLSGRG